MDRPLQYLQWVLSSHPPGQKAIESRWGFKIKDVTIEIFKSRFVAQGFPQVFGSDYDETFAPIAKLCTLRNCFALAVSWTTFVVQFDVRSALLNANLSDDIYIEQPEGFAPARANGETLYCKREFVLPAEDHCLYCCDGTNGSHFLYLGQRFGSTTFCTFQTTTKSCMISRRNSAMHLASMIVGK